MIRYVRMAIRMPSLDAQLPDHDGNPTGRDRFAVDRLLVDSLHPEYRGDLDVGLDDEDGVKFLAVEVCGLNDETSEIIRRRVEDLLVEHFQPRVRNLITVKVLEFAGTPER